MKKQLILWLMKFYCIQAFLFAFVSIGYLWGGLNGGLLQWAFSFFSLLGHMALLGLLPGLLVLILATCVYPQKTFIYILNVLVSTSLLFLLILDLAVFKLFNSHIAPFLPVIFSSGGMQFFDLSSSDWGSIIGIFVGLLLIQSLISYFLPCRNQQALGFMRKQKFIKSSLCIFLASFVCSDLIYAWADVKSQTPVLMVAHSFPYYKGLTIRSFAKKHLHITESPVMFKFRRDIDLHNGGSFHYPHHKVTYSLKRKQLPNIMFILIDMWRADMMNNKTSPYIFNLAQHNLWFKKHISGGDGTKPGIFSLFYSIPANYYEKASSLNKRPVWFRVLKHYNYDVNIAQSASMVAPAFKKNVFAGIPGVSMNTPGTSPWQRDKYITQQMIRFLNKPHSQPFFGFMFYDAVHGYTYPPSMPLKFKPAVPMNSLMAAITKDRQPYINQYRNAVYYDDGLVKQVIETLKANKQWRNTIVIITSDHGEEFNDYNLKRWGHTQDMTPAETHVPFIIHWPGLAEKKYEHVTTHYDVMPTLLKRVFKIKNPAADYSVGVDLFNTQNRYPFIINSCVISSIMMPSKYLMLKKWLYEAYDYTGHPIQGNKFAVTAFKKGYFLLHTFD